MKRTTTSLLFEVFNNMRPCPRPQLHLQLHLLTHNTASGSDMSADPSMSSISGMAVDTDPSSESDSWFSEHYIDLYVDLPDAERAPYTPALSCANEECSWRTDRRGAFCYICRLRWSPLEFTACLCCGRRFLRSPSQDICIECMY